jgi:lipopolysaccharide/colanic/teichoic acid biosynthesis glycosyltransferase
MNALAQRFRDVVLVLVSAPLTLPLALLVAAAVAVGVGRPILFVQRRPGLGGRLFRLVKFRSMTGATGRDGALLPDAERLTPVGRLLRSTSLDELPTLWNVLGGDMSLVGPRPLLPEYLPLYTERQARRHEVLPGITGWAQVNGRNAVSWEERLEMDVWYVEHRSLRLDLRILWKTVGVVVRREGIAHEGAATMTHFRGTDD